MHSGIGTDIMVFWVEDTAEWCAAYMPESFYGYGRTQAQAARELRRLLREHHGWLSRRIAAYTGPDGDVIDLTAWRRHKLVTCPSNS